MIRRLAPRAALFALIWWILAEGRADGWALGALAVAGALWASLRLSPPGASTFDTAALFGFAGFFLWNSVKGGIQVAMLALRERRALMPGMREFTLALPPGAPRLLMVNALGLMPGTVGVGLVDDRLRLHLIDTRLPVEAEVRALEARVARIFGERS